MRQAMMTSNSNSKMKKGKMSKINKNQVDYGCYIQYKRNMPY